LLPYRPPWLGERRVGKRSNSYADEIGAEVCEPIHGRAASGAEMKAEFSSHPPAANIRGARAVRAHIGFSEISGYTKRCARAPLTFDAMTGDDEDWIGNHFSLERSAATACRTRPPTASRSAELARIARQISDQRYRRSDLVLNGQGGQAWQSEARSSADR
jgi:hypothetical protein